MDISFYFSSRYRSYDIYDKGNLSTYITSDLSDSVVVLEKESAIESWVFNEVIQSYFDTFFEVNCDGESSKVPNVVKKFDLRHPDSQCITNQKRVYIDIII